MTSWDWSHWVTLLMMLTGRHNRGRLDEVTAENITQLLDSYGQQLSNEDLEDMVKELNQQK